MRTCKTMVVAGMVYSVDCGVLLDVWLMRRESVKRAAVARLLREVWSTRRERLKRGLQVVCQLKIMVFCWCALKGFNGVLFIFLAPPPPPTPPPFFCLFCCDASHEHLQTFLVVICRIYDSPFSFFFFFFLFLLEVHKVILLIIILALV